MPWDENCVGTEGFFGFSSLKRFQRPHRRPSSLDLRPRVFGCSDAVCEAAISTVSRMWTSIQWILFRGSRRSHEKSTEDVFKWFLVVCIFKASDLFWRDSIAWKEVSEILPLVGFKAYIFSDRCAQNLQQHFSTNLLLKYFFHISLKYSNLGITPVKITEILRNSDFFWKNRWIFDKHLQKSAVFFENQQKLRRI